MRREKSIKEEDDDGWQKKKSAASLGMNGTLFGIRRVGKKNERKKYYV